MELVEKEEIWNHLDGRPVRGKLPDFKLSLTLLILLTRDSNRYMYFVCSFVVPVARSWRPRTICIFFLSLFTSFPYPFFSQKLASFAFMIPGPPVTTH